MADFLSKIFLLSPQKSENNHLGEASLMQGARFNKMQSAIENAGLFSFSINGTNNRRRVGIN